MPPEPGRIVDSGRGCAPPGKTKPGRIVGWVYLGFATAVDEPLSQLCCPGMGKRTTSDLGDVSNVSCVLCGASGFRPRYRPRMHRGAPRHVLGRTSESWVHSVRGTGGVVNKENRDAVITNRYHTLWFELSARRTLSRGELSCEVERQPRFVRSNAELAGVNSRLETYGGDSVG